MKTRYTSLRFIASVIKFFAYCFLIIAILEVCLIFLSTKELNSLTAGELKLGRFVTWINTIMGLNSAAILIGGVISFIPISSLSEIIILFIDVEYNTRNTQFTIEKTLDLLERRFGMKSVEPQKNKSILNKLIDGDYTNNNDIKTDFNNSIKEFKLDNNPNINYENLNSIKESLSVIANEILEKRKNEEEEKKKKIDYHLEQECFNEIIEIIKEHNRIEDDEELKLNIGSPNTLDELMNNYYDSRANINKSISAEKEEMNRDFLNKLESKIKSRITSLEFKKSLTQ